MRFAVPSAFAEGRLRLGRVIRKPVIHRVKLLVELLAGSVIRNVLVGRRVAFVEPFAEGRLAGL